MKKVLVLGATGKMGNSVAQKTLDAGHSLRVLVRNKNKFTLSGKNVEVFEGDVSNSEDINKVVEGVDVVISCLGNVKKVYIMEKAFDNILIAAAAQTKPPKCLLITTVGVGGTSFLIRLVLTLISIPTAPYTMFDYEKADRRARKEQKVPLLIVRPYALTEGEEDGYQVVTKKRGTFLRPISRKDVAQFLVDSINSDEWKDRKSVMLGGVKK